MAASLTGELVQDNIKEQAENETASLTLTDHDQAQDTIVCMYV